MLMEEPKKKKKKRPVKYRLNVIIPGYAKRSCLVETYVRGKGWAGALF